MKFDKDILFTIIIFMTIFCAILVFISSANAEPCEFLQYQAYEEDYDADYSNIAYSTDLNINTFALSGSGAIGIEEFIEYSAPSMYDFEFITGCMIYARENFRETYYDAEVTIEINGITEFSSVTVQKDKWNYYNFTGVYDKDLTVFTNLTHTIANSKIECFEVYILGLYNATPNLNYVYPLSTSECVQPKPTISLRVLEGYIADDITPSTKCYQMINTTIRSNVSGEWLDYYSLEFTQSVSSTSYWVNYSMEKFWKINTYYWYSYNITDGDEWTNKTWKIFIDDCPFNYPSIDGLSNPDCWHMVSAYTLNYSYYLSVGYLYVYNTTSETGLEWSDAISTNKIFNGLYHWNETTQEYDNVTKYTMGEGYWFYSYDDNYSKIYSLPSNTVTSEMHFYNNTNTQNDTLYYYNHTTIISFQYNNFDYGQFNYNTHPSFPAHWGLNLTECEGECNFPIYINWTNGNITVNVTITDCDGTNTTNATVNDENYLFLAGLSLDPELMIIFIFFIFQYFAFSKSEITIKGLPINTVILIFAGLIAIITGVYYIGWQIEITSKLVGISFVMFGIFDIGLFLAYALATAIPSN